MNPNQIIGELSPPLTTNQHGDNDSRQGLLVPEVANPLTARMQKGVNTTLDEGQTIVSDVAPTMRAGGNNTGGDRPYGTDVDTCDSLVAFDCKGTEVQNDDSGAAPPLRAMGHAEKYNNGGGHAAIAYGFEPRNREDDGRGYAREPHFNEGLSGTLNAAKPSAVAFDMRGRDGVNMPEGPHDTANIRAASGGSSRSYVAEPWAVRRLTPVECERLQGFPDGYTDIPPPNKTSTPDGPRYKALGNSMAVNVMRWIGRRIDLINSLGE